MQYQSGVDINSDPIVAQAIDLQRATISCFYNLSKSESYNNFIHKVADKSVFDKNLDIEPNWRAYSLKVFITIESLIHKEVNKT